MDDADEHEEFEPLVVIEAWDRVSIGLLGRIVSGEAPDGTMYGESLQMGRQAALDVALARSLGTRPLLDASTGEVVPPCRAAVGRPAARRGSGHAFLALVLTLPRPSASMRLGTAASIRRSEQRGVAFAW